MSSHRIIQGDCIEGLRTLPDASVHCCVTSPPYWGLRDYGHDGQIGLESTPEAYVARMVEVFREVRRVLREDGTLWLNLGDTYGSGKQLKGIPWRVAFALQADGWVLRQDIIWHKPNPMPESVRDRCTKAHEYVFLLTKSERYFYDAEAVSEAAKDPSGHKYERGTYRAMRDAAALEGTAFDGPTRSHIGNTRVNGKCVKYAAGHGANKNRRSVWTVTTRPYKGAHFATMPPALVEPCILAGCQEGGTVLDPFAGSGTTLAVAAELGRSGIGCELNPEYIELAEQRIAKSKAKMPLFVA
jgi:site-specific DNA-methyltransferase (adenine-specific)